MTKAARLKLKNIEAQKARIAEGGLLTKLNDFVHENFEDYVGIEPASLIECLLIEARHLCDAHELDYDSINAAAHETYLEELKYLEVE